MENNYNAPVLKERLMCLDALRGLDMFFLIGLAYIFRALPELSDNSVFIWLDKQSHHPDWQGFTLYDMIFPMFIFIVGVAMPFSFSKRMEKAGGKRKLYKHILIRTVILAILGVVLWKQPGGPHPHYGFYSVLYRIGFSYFFAAIILMNTKIRGQIYWAFGIAIGYWLLLRFVPVPGYGAGNFTEAGNLTTYIGNHVSNLISPNFRYVISLSLLPSVSTALFGVLAGQWLRSEKRPTEKTMGMLLWGAGLIILGLLIHLDFPINKKLATTSFVFLASGISTLSLAVFYWVIDVKGYKKWSFFLVVIGLNPITIYVAGFLVRFNDVTNVFVGAFDFGMARALVFAIVLTTIKWLFLYYLYRQKVFLKI